MVRKTKIEIFKAIMALEPRAPVFVELAEALIEDGQFEAAIGVCRQGLAHHPDLLAGQVALIEALLAAGQTEEAAMALAQARQRAAWTSQSLSRLSQLESRLESLEIEKAKAEAAAKTGESDWTSQPFTGLASPTLADLYLKQGLPEAAVGVYKKLLAKDPANRAIRAKLKSLGLSLPSEAKLRLLEILLKWQAALSQRVATAAV